jgi:hypothetical protein
MATTGSDPCIFYNYFAGFPGPASCMESGQLWNARLQKCVNQVTVCAQVMKSCKGH